jgi:hypothetical protein
MNNFIFKTYTDMNAMILKEQSNFFAKNGYTLFSILENNNHIFTLIFVDTIFNEDVIKQLLLYKI